MIQFLEKYNIYKARSIVFESVGRDHSKILDKHKINPNFSKHKNPKPGGGGGRCT